MKSNYLENLNSEVREYFKILSPEFPDWLLEYIDTPEMQRIGGISIFCGTDYTKIFNNRFWYSNLDHSVGVALIIWHFTNDKKQTLAGLFHDISTPTFKHCIDFMNGDSERQESTEGRTEDIIKNSKEIMSLLERDNIKLEEISDYHIYPIADNDTPKLSADRFEYTFANGLSFSRTKLWDLETIKEIYNDVYISKDENNIDELAFKTPEICEKYVTTIANLWPQWISNEDRVTLQFFADIVKSMNVKKLITINDLYTYSEKDIVERILNCPDSYIKDSFVKFQNSTSVWNSATPVSDKYCISTRGKRRYIVPLVEYNGKTERINNVSTKAKEAIDNYLQIEQAKYVGLDFNFVPYN